MNSLPLCIALAAVVGGMLMPAASAVAGTDPKEAHLGGIRADRILFLGNSVTLHGPAPQIGWSGNWGMAASAAEKDYVHLLLRALSEATGHTPEAMVLSIADFERNYGTYDVGSTLKKPLEFHADLVIVAIGENVPAFPSEEARTQFRHAFASLLAALKRHGSPTLFVRSCFWPDKAKDEAMRQVCREAGGTFVDISRLMQNELNCARSERKIAHAGVAAHPGDRGMKAIADALWEAITERTSPAGH
jgi:hypothetical protein